MAVPGGNRVGSGSGPSLWGWFSRGVGKELRAVEVQPVGIVNQLPGNGGAEGLRAAAIIRHFAIGQERPAEGQEQFMQVRGHLFGKGRERAVGIHRHGRIHAEEPVGKRVADHDGIVLRRFFGSQTAEGADVSVNVVAGKIYIESVADGPAIIIREFRRAQETDDVGPIRQGIKRSGRAIQDGAIIGVTIQLY